MSTTFPTLHGINIEDHRGQLIYGLCPGCHSWQIDFVNGGSCRNMADAEVETHIKECRGKFSCLEDMDIDLYYFTCELDARDGHTTHEGSGTSDNGFKYEVKWYVSKEVSTDRAVPPSEGSP